MGRPSIYSDELFQEICDRLSEGEPLAQICRDEHMPCVSTVANWEDQREGVSASIARARRLGFDAIAARARVTARGKTTDEGGESSGDVQRDKLIIEADLKLLAKWDPRRYGERQLVGSDPDNPLPTGVTVVFRKTDAADDPAVAEGWLSHPADQCSGGPRGRAAVSDSPRANLRAGRGRQGSGPP